MATCLVPHSGKLLTIAGTAAWSHGHQRLDWLYAHDFAIDTAPHPDHLQRLGPRIWPYVQKGLPIRINALMPGYELGDGEPAAARRALTQHMKMVDAVSEYTDAVIVCRIGLTPRRGISGRRAVANLTALAAYGARNGVTIALANHKTGPTATPERHLLWARRSGARVVLDLGQFLGSGARRRLSLARYIDLAAPNLTGAYLYPGTTLGGHRAPGGMRLFAPAIQRLAQTDCRWLTIDLVHPRAMKTARRLTFDVLDRQAEALYRSVVCDRLPTLG